jgi:hypothetical protein
MCAALQFCAAFHASSYPSSHRHAASAVLPSPFHVGQSIPSGCHTTPSSTPAPPADPCLAARLLSLPFTSTESCVPIKPNRAPPFCCSPFLLPPRPPTPSRRHTFLAGICRDSFTPSKSPRPTASPPPPLAPRPDPVQPPALLCRNCAYPEPPLAGAARRPPHR